MCSMAAEKSITIKELSKKYKLGEGFFKIHLCRAEFNKYRITSTQYHNCYGFIYALEHVLRLKKHSNKCKITNIPHMEDIQNYYLN